MVVTEAHRDMAEPRDMEEEEATEVNRAEEVMDLLVEDTEDLPVADTIQVALHLHLPKGHRLEPIPSAYDSIIGEFWLTHLYLFLGCR